MAANDNPYFSTMGGQTGHEQLNYNAPTLAGTAGPAGPQNSRRRRRPQSYQIPQSAPQYQGGHFPDWGTGTTGAAGPMGPQGPTAPVNPALLDAQRRWMDAIGSGGNPAPAASGGPGGPAAPAGPNYDALAQAALGRINPIYDQLGAFGDQINQQRKDASAYTNNRISDSAAARYAEMANINNTGWQSDATRAESAYQLNALRNSGLAQDEYARRMDQMNELDYTSNTNAIAQARAAQQAGIWANANAGKTAAAAGGGGGGGSTSGGNDGEYTDAELLARGRVLNMGRSKSPRALDWLTATYGQGGGPKIREVVKFLRKSNGTGVAEMIRRFGGTELERGSNVRREKNPQVMNLLREFSKIRAARITPNGVSALESARSLDASRG